VKVFVRLRGSTDLVFLRVDSAKEPTPGDFMPDAYLLCNQAGTRRCRFVPHNGLERLS